MKKFIHIYITAILLLSAFAPVFAQSPQLSGVRIENQTVVKENDVFTVNMDIVLNDLHVRTNELFLLTPVIAANNGEQKMALQPVAITGKRRQKMIDRASVLNNMPLFETAPQTVLLRKNKTAQTINYAVQIPAESWMNNASLSLTESVTGCADCDKGSEQWMLAERIHAPLYIPTYKLTYIVPEAAKKEFSATHAARFNYKVARHELLPDFGNNARELAEVDKVVREIRDDNDLLITSLTISGYASPEGSVSSNMSLSQRRANTFAEYLVTRYNLNRNQFKVNWYGEDWNGLEKALHESNIQDKEAILHIISTVSNPDARDAGLKKLSGGQTYRILLEQYYPPLRRNEYTIAYEARAFNVEEAKEVIKTRPQLLSLNEMYLVAQTYPADSKEFKEVFDIAARLFPHEPIANINSAATDMEGGNNQAAVDRLMKIESDARAWNNLGVAYARMGESDKAKTYFERAAARGDKDAAANLEELGKTITN